MRSRGRERERHEKDERGKRDTEEKGREEGTEDKTEGREQRQGGKMSLIRKKEGEERLEGKREET